MSKEKSVTTTCQSTMGDTTYTISADGMYAKVRTSMLNRLIEKSRKWDALVKNYSEYKDQKIITVPRHTLEEMMEDD